MQINNAKEYKLVWRIYDLLTELDAPWPEIDECLVAISDYNQKTTKYKSGHQYGIKI